MLKLSFFTLFFLLNVSAHAFDSSVGDIIIESENLDIDIQAKKADFCGKVIVKQDNIKISTDKLTLFFQNKKIEKIDFSNNVKLQMFDKLVLGDRAEYTKIIIL